MYKLLSGETMSHNINVPSQYLKDGKKFVHYLEGCLCQYSKHYYYCRLRQERLSVITIDTKQHEKPQLTVEEVLQKLNDTDKLVLKILSQKELSRRELAIETRYSARHIHRILKKLEGLGLITRIAELVKDQTLTTDLRLVQTYERIWKYTLTELGRKVLEVIK